MLEMLGNTLSIYSEYEKLMSTDVRVRSALAKVYADVLSILTKAHTLFRKRGRSFRQTQYLSAVLIYKQVFSFSSVSHGEISNPIFKTI